MSIKGKRLPTLTNQHSYKVSQFHKHLKACCGQKLSKLHVSKWPSAYQLLHKFLRNFRFYFPFISKKWEELHVIVDIVFLFCRIHASTIPKSILSSSYKISQPNKNLRSLTSILKRRATVGNINAWCNCQHCRSLFARDLVIR